MHKNLFFLIEIIDKQGNFCNLQFITNEELKTVFRIDSLSRIWIKVTKATIPFIYNFIVENQKHLDRVYLFMFEGVLNEFYSNNVLYYDDKTKKVEKTPSENNRALGFEEIEAMIEMYDKKIPSLYFDNYNLLLSCLYPDLNISGDKKINLTKRFGFDFVSPTKILMSKYKEIILNLNVDEYEQTSLLINVIGGFIKNQNLMYKLSGSPIEDVYSLLSKLNRNVMGFQERELMNYLDTKEIKPEEKNQIVGKPNF